MIKKTLKKAQYGSSVGPSSNPTVRPSKPESISKAGKDFLKKIGKTSPRVSPEIMPKPYSKVKPASQTMSPDSARKVAKKLLGFKKNGGSLKSKKK